MHLCDVFKQQSQISFTNQDFKMCRGVAQLVAYSLWERGVVSSSLAAPTRKIKVHCLRVMFFFI